MYAAVNKVEFGVPLATLSEEDARTSAQRSWRERRGSPGPAPVTAIAVTDSSGTHGLPIGGCGHEEIAVKIILTKDLELMIILNTKTDRLRSQGDAWFTPDSP